MPPGRLTSWADQVRAFRAFVLCGGQACPPETGLINSLVPRAAKAPQPRHWRLRPWRTPWRTRSPAALH